jgi:hypothetical protein
MWLDKLADDMRVPTLLIPDNDGPGERFMDRVQESLLKRGRLVDRISFADEAEGYDIVDFLKTHDIGELLSKIQWFNPPDHYIEPQIEA